MDHVDHHAVLDLVLLTGEQLGRRKTIGVGIARAGRGAGEGVGTHRAALHFDEQFRRGADEAVDAVAMAEPEHRLQPQQNGMDVDRFGAADLYFASDDGLGEPASADRVASCGHGGEIEIDRGEGSYGELLGPRSGGRDRCQVGLGTVDGGDPPAAVGGLAHGDRGDQ